MSPKLKSLLYLLCFILSALIYQHFEVTEKEKTTNKSSNFVSLEITDLDEDEDASSEQEVDVMNEEITTE